MMKNLALTASIITLVVISGQAFARAAGSNTRYLPQAANSSDQQLVPTYNAYDYGAYDAFDDQSMATQMVEPDAYRYHGGPKGND